MTDGATFIGTVRELSVRWLWQDAEQLKWWLDILLMANEEDKTVRVGEAILTVKRGQLMASVRSLCDRWASHDHNGNIVKKPSTKRVHQFLTLLDADGMIRRDFAKRKSTIITICNYDSYNTSEKHSRNTHETLTKHNSSILNDCDSENYDTSEKQSRNTNGNTDEKKEKRKKENIPPAPPIKERNKKERKASTNVELRAAAEPPLAEAKTKENPAAEKTEKLLQTAARDVFETFYRETFNEPYYWQSKDAGAMKRLLAQIKFSREHRDVPLPTADSDMVAALRLFLEAINDDWIMQHFSVAIVSNKYNEIKSQYKPKNDNANYKADRLSRRRGVEPSAKSAADFSETL